MTTVTKNLYQKLLLITEEIGKIEKTGRNSQQGYEFIEQAQVVAEVRVQLAKHGVMIIPETVSRTLGRYEVTRSNGKPGVDIHARVASRYTLVNADNPDEKMVCEWDAGEAIDSGDKATNKATTASHKYFLMKLFNISDKDDPDAETPVAAPQQSPTSPEPVPDESGFDPDLASEVKRAMFGAKILTDTEKHQFYNLTINKDKPKTDDDLKELLKALSA